MVLLDLAAAIADVISRRKGEHMKRVHVSGQVNKYFEIYGCDFCSLCDELLGVLRKYAKR
jgi:hypothetical protein